MTRPDNPLAFPASTDGFGNFLKGTPGMDLRDFFAAHALAGIIANPGTPDQMIGMGFKGSKSALAEYAFAAADAMLLARTPNEIGEEG